MGEVKDVERQKAKLYNLIQDLQQMHNFLEENTERLVAGFKAREAERKDKKKRRTITTEIFSDELQ
jgi:alpha-D-ribose 1-methylphosphonate 5-triphosphate synthase subunit PhnG